MKQFSIFFIFYPVLFFTACSEKKIRPTFGPVAEIKFIEVRRSYDTGSSFSKMGFQQNPEWVLYFMKNDSARIYSPKEHRFIHYKAYYSHDSVFNFAREWFRLKMMTKDSLLLQLLKVGSDKVISQEQSNVYMKFYSEKYLQKINADPERLKLPNRFDTLFIRRKSAIANRNPTELDSLFACRVPVNFKSRSPRIRVIQVPASQSVLDDPSPADYYLKPEFDIRIDGAFKDFSYSYVASVDEKGKIWLIKSLQPAEDMAGRIKNIEVVNEFYLQRNLVITPGNTLGILHASKIVLNVTGKK